MKSMGYIIDDAEEVYNIIAESAKKEQCVVIWNLAKLL